MPNALACRLKKCSYLEVRRYIALLGSLLISSLTVGQAADLTSQQENLQQPKSICLLAAKDNIIINDMGWLDTSLPDDLYSIIKNKLTIYKIPLKVGSDCLEYPTYYATFSLDATKVNPSGFRAVAVSLYVDGWGIPTGVSDSRISNVKIWETGTVFLTIKGSYDFSQDLRQKLAELLDELAADWVKAH